jgi:hypothetical protein
MKTTDATQARRRELLRQMDAIIHELQTLDLQDNLPSHRSFQPPAPSFTKGDRVRVISTRDPTWYQQTGTVQAPRGITYWNVLMDLRPGDTRRHLIYRTPKYLELVPLPPEASKPASD